MTRMRYLGAAVALALLVVAPFTQATYGTYVLTSWLVFSIAAMGLNMTLGYAGQISLAQATFMGIGAYSTALLTVAGYPWILSVGVALVLCFSVGLVLGYPAMRVQHHMLAFVTLAFATIMFLLMRNEEWLTGGSYGLAGLPRPAIGEIPMIGPRLFYYFTLAIFLIAFAVFYWIVRSPWGRAFKALRENSIRANSLGVDTRTITLLSFAIGAAYGGLSGTLFAPLVQFIEPNSFTLDVSLKVLLMVVVGGSGSLLGPILGAGIVIILPEVMRFAQEYYLMLYSVLVVLLMIFCPSGIVGLGKRAASIVQRKPVERGDLKEGALL